MDQVLVGAEGAVRLYESERIEQRLVFRRQKDDSAEAFNGRQVKLWRRDTR
jgi:hypothetical protein